MIQLLQENNSVVKWFGKLKHGDKMSHYKEEKCTNGRDCHNSKELVTPFIFYACIFFFTITEHNNRCYRVVQLVWQLLLMLVNWQESLEVEQHNVVL